MEKLLLIILLGDGVMSMVHYEPFSLINQLQQDINSLFSRAESSDTSSATAAWVPATDIAEYPDRFELAIDLPGVNLESVDLSLEKGTLTVSGDRNPLRSVSEEEPIRHRVERLEGRFHRRFILPDTVDSENVRATGDNGVLRITIPKAPAVQPRRIAIQT
jgi:HSP20 family protein